VTFDDRGGAPTVPFDGTVTETITTKTTTETRRIHSNSDHPINKSVRLSEFRTAFNNNISFINLLIRIAVKTTLLFYFTHHNTKK